MGFRKVSLFGAFAAAVLLVACGQPASSVQPLAAVPTLAPAAPAAASCEKSIDVNLSRQELVARDCDGVFLSTPITSGRPGLRTPTGTFNVFLKQQDVTFISPWPEGDPNYYPPMPVAYAMEFLDGGYFLHTDPDEPVSAFGRGSEDGLYASHGCVHVPYAVMSGLYAWADDGTQVSIHY
ncbi:MAG TPA: L,D-transpeptidase [Candidatus Dormibacteraeota bacterium]|nr:L,D-transpeptidase [Candidatus Dormibacteraeota bacterium]